GDRTDVTRTDTNPFYGDVDFVKVTISRRVNYSSGRQWLRNMRSKLMEKGNVEAAAIFRSAELSLARHIEPWPNKIVSLIYELGSDFGHSIGRPLAWLG